MSELLKKYKDRNEYLEQLTGLFRELVSTLLSHYKPLVKGDDTLIKSIDALIARAKVAKNIFQLQQISKDFRKLSKGINEKVKKGGGSGGFLSGLISAIGNIGRGSPTRTIVKIQKKEGGGYDIVDELREVISPYLSLLDEMSKGIILLANEKDPFYEKLLSLRKKKFEQLNEIDSSSISKSLYNFFITKSNEAGAVKKEREELKKVISSLTGYIQSLSVSSEKFGTKLDLYSQKIRETDDIEEIKKIKSSILGETLEIQKVNNSVLEELEKANKELEEATKRIVQLEEDLETARQDTFTDAMTQIYNRGYFDEKLKESIATAKRDKTPFCLIMFDIDNFKSFNDTYGHQAGDQVIKTVAGISKDTVRTTDTVARYGGEEFAVIAHNANLENSTATADKIRKNIEEHEFVAKKKTIHVTVSVGVTKFSSGDDSKDIIERADTGLYQAKKEGKNKVCKV